MLAWLNGSRAFQSVTIFYCAPHSKFIVLSSSQKLDTCLMVLPIQTRGLVRGIAGLVLVGLGYCAFLITPRLGAQIASRTDQIQASRTDKLARLWPERTSGIVKRANDYLDRGFLEFVEEKKGSNGLQFVLGGMRSGSGTTFGVGYRRVDLYDERLAFRATARGTLQKAYMLDLELESPRLRHKRGDVRLYIKHENSPMMDYYGAGPDSQKSGRTSYRLEDTGIDGSGRYRVWSHLYLGATGGVYLPNVGPGQRDGVTSTEAIYTPVQVPGLGRQPKFFRAGGTLEFDYRDLATGPREGGHYYTRHLRYWDRESGLYTFHMLDSAIEQYLPYWNKTRVVALRLGSMMTWAGEGKAIPFYLQPTLGGNDFLRGFDRYRFYDQNSIHAVAEHRWYVSSIAHGALFFEMGKVARKASQLNFHNLEYAGGIGIRFTVRDAVVMRIEAAASHEGVRGMWTFSNMW